MMSDITLNKPTPILSAPQTIPFKRGSDSRAAIQELEAGNAVLITAFYGNGLDLMLELKKHLTRKFPKKTFLEQRKYREAYHRLSSLVFIEIKDHKLAVKKEPTIGWLEKLYPETPNFFLTFPQVQGLNSSWQWYTNGITVPVLRNKLHPYYGTYFPTRFDHLILFDNWLKRYEGPKKSAIDVGIGSGVLAFQLVKHGFQKVFGTDTNPNSIVGIKDFMGETKLSRKVELDHGSLFGKWTKQTELIIFNPPWIPKLNDIESVDEAIYYDEELFPAFFEKAVDMLLPDGKLVLIFSNLAQITNVTKKHPIAKEISKGGRFKLEKCFKKSVKGASDKTKRDQNWRGSEEVELWVLVKK